jgi:hypothetical protein
VVDGNFIWVGNHGIPPFAPRGKMAMCDSVPVDCVDKRSHPRARWTGCAGSETAPRNYMKAQMTVA